MRRRAQQDRLVEECKTIVLNRFGSENENGIAFEPKVATKRFVESDEKCPQSD